jgi:hypothetical protein
VSIQLVLLFLVSPEPSEPARRFQSLVVAVLVESDDTLVVLDTGVRVCLKDKVKAELARCAGREVSHFYHLLLKKI